MGWEEVKDEKEGYVRVRKANDRGSLVGRMRDANDNPEAKGYIELNKDDLGGMEGGGGPHSHSEYASKTHAHDDKADKDHTHDTSHTHDDFSDKDHTHPPQDLTHDHDDEYADKTTTNQILNALATDINSLETKTYNNQEAIKGKSDSDHTHDAPDLTHEHEGMVVSDSVTSIVRLSQSEYDALVDKDASTLYLVV